MPAALDTIHAIGLVSCFALLGTSRIGACIRWLSLQGIVFGLVPLLAHDDGIGLAQPGLEERTIELRQPIAVHVQDNPDFRVKAADHRNKLRKIVNVDDVALAGRQMPRYLVDVSGAINA